jgi:ribosomal protein S18 acetylase RimI-like enzyme
VPMKIQRATPKDAKVITDITIAAKRHWNYPESWIQMWLPALTISAEYISENEVWTALGQNGPAAYYSLQQNGDGWWLDNLWVLPEFAGQGIGRQLFQHALERSRERGATALKIEADPNAQGFYEKMGALKVGEHHGEIDGQVRRLPVMEINL